MDKQREYWDCGDLEIALDKVKGLGDFIEVEVKGKFGSTEQAKQACFTFLDQIGIKDARDMEIKNGYSTMLLEKMKNKVRNN